MVKNKALSECNGNSTWAAPTFSVPMKINGIQIVSGFYKKMKQSSVKIDQYNYSRCATLMWMHDIHYSSMDGNAVLYHVCQGRPDKTSSQHTNME